MVASAPPWRWPRGAEQEAPKQGGDHLALTLLIQTGNDRSAPSPVNALDTMRALADKAEVQTFGPGEWIFRSGESGDTMFGLLEGSVELIWNGETGHEEIKAGDVFGAGALVMPDHRRYGDARSLTSSRILVMNREKFLFAVQEAPMFAIELLASIDDRLRHLKDHSRG